MITCSLVNSKPVFFRLCPYVVMVRRSSTIHNPTLRVMFAVLVYTPLVNNDPAIQTVDNSQSKIDFSVSRILHCSSTLRR